MRIQGRNFYITEKRPFIGVKFNEMMYIEQAFQFAWDMTFGQVGEHRNHRTGGNRRRKNGEIFINTFQGKLAEFAVYQKFVTNQITITYPDLQEYGLGQWDISDFTVNNNHIAVKSTKHYGNLLLLETKDLNQKGIYLPSNIAYQYIILVRISPDGEGIMKNNRLLFSDMCRQEDLKKNILGQDWKFDIGGVIDHRELLEVINRREIINQNAMLNGSVIMDAENYYVEAGNMHLIDELYPLLR